MPDQSLLDKVSIVLVEPRTPANVGAIARCMMNMGLESLVLVHPLKPFDEEAFKLAAGAEEILQRAVFAHTLAEAVKDRSIVIGTSRHAGKKRKDAKSPRSMAREVLPLLANNRAAVVFGNEVNGLDTAALALCTEIVTIPSSSRFSSLNLSHAVMVIAYELFAAFLESHTASDRSVASSDELERFYRHLQDTLGMTGFLDRDRPEHIMLILRQLFARSRPDRRDVRILRGILTSINARCK
ncbi:MAG TPA: RNA methyltransferase [Nitrospirota bacterium]|nr:RNA methyltransferase [Nitrospirota bacterium]